MWFHPYTLPFLDVREHSVIVYSPSPHFVKFWFPNSQTFKVFETSKVSLTNKKMGSASLAHHEACAIIKLSQTGGNEVLL